MRSVIFSQCRDRMIEVINTKNCSLSIVLTAKDQKPQKIIKKMILPTITLLECQRHAK